jgi:hypothetical protein
MSLFGGKDKKRVPEAVEDAPQKKELSILDDATLAALPRKSTFFDGLRSDAFMNHNVVENFVEFWAALKVNPDEDKWRVMHYMVYDLDQKDGKFVSEPSTKHDVSFAEAVAYVAKQEYIAEKMATHKELDLESIYPAAKYPELKVHFYDLTHYKRGANIEGIAFDELNQPYRRVEGRIFQQGTFKRSEVVKSILAVEQAKDIPSVQAKIEGGILSDIFATASDRAASLDNILKIGQVLSTMDEFASQVGAFYLSIQRALNRDDKFDRIEGLQPEEKKDVLTRAEDFVTVRKDDAKPFPKIIDDLIPQMNAQLESAKNLGVHVEPFQKFAAECELYANLLYASQNLAKLERGFVSVNNSDANLITQIRDSVDKAQRKFIDLGGTQEQMDKLKAWVANPKKDPIPNWLPGFLTRYYESRGKVMQRVQDRQAGISQVNTMSVDVKPPVTDQYNEVAKPRDIPAQPAPSNDNSGVGSQGPDFDKFKNIMGNRPKP